MVAELVTAKMRPSCYPAQRLPRVMPSKCAGTPEIGSASKLTDASPASGEHNVCVER